MGNERRGKRAIASVAIEGFGPVFGRIRNPDIARWLNVSQTDFADGSSGRATFHSSRDWVIAACIQDDQPHLAAAQIIQDPFQAKSFARNGGVRLKFCIYGDQPVLS